MFSIVVPIYNVSKYLRRCIESIINQTYKDFEVIMVDDGSLDDSFVICKEYSKKDDRIKVIHKPNGGLVSARKAGAKVASGEYIISVDGDDFIDINLLSNMYDILIQHGDIDVVGFGYKRFDKKVSEMVFYDSADEGLYVNDKLYSLKKKYLYDSTLSYTNSGSILYMIWSKAIKKDLYIDLQLEMNDKITNGEDTVLMGRILEKCKSYYCCHTPLYFYQINRQSMTNVRHPKDLENVVLVVKELKKNAIINENSIKAYYIFQTWIVISDYIRATKSLKLLKKFVKSVDYCYEVDFTNTLNNSLKMRIKKYCIIKKKYFFHYILVRCFNL